MGTPANVKLGPGLLYIAAAQTTEIATPTATIPSATWTAIGYTEDGSEFTVDPTFEDVEVAEELDPVKVVATKRQTTIKFEMAEISVAHLQYALNGGTTSTVSGYTRFVPPDLGTETRKALYWRADDGTEQLTVFRVLQVGTVTIPRKKAPAKAKIPVEFKVEIPSDGTDPWAYVSATA